MIYLFMVLMMGTQRVDVRVHFPTQEACEVERASITSKTKRYAGWAGADLITSECIKA